LYNSQESEDYMATIFQQIELPSELYERLQALSKRQKRSISDLLLEAATEFVDLEWDEDESTESVKAAFLEGWHEAITNAPARPIWDILQELDDDEEA
jgi:predicted transcriptional regulator